jgi:hypothetical protein
MGDMNTITMLKNEFCALIGDDWALYPSLSYLRFRDGTVRHHTTRNLEEVREAQALNIWFELPDKIQTDVGRGTEIILRTDLLRVLDYWAQANQTAMVGVSLYLDNHTVEYWITVTRDPIANEPLDAHLVALQQQWREKIRKMSPSVAQCLDNAPMRYTFKMRYQRNLLRVWFTLDDFARAGLNESLAEVPVVKDRWIAEEAEVITFRPLTDEIAANSVQILFGRHL